MVPLALLILLIALPASAATLTFDQALLRAYRARGIGELPQDALRVLENPEGLELPAMRVEAAWSDVRKIDIVHDSLLVNVDYPLLDGGARELRRRSSILAATSFRERSRELANQVFDETVDAVAQLYIAQERRRILQTGFDRALSMRKRADDLLIAHEISNLTAAQWQDEAIAAESQLIDLDLKRLEAETRVKQLIGDTTEDAIEIALDLSSRAESRDPSVPRNVDQRQLGLDLARAVRRPQLMLSAFGGVASLPGESRSPLFGVRVTLALPMFDAAMRRREAEARLDLAAAEMDRASIVERERREETANAIAIEGFAKRIDLLSRAVEVARERGASLARLTAAGLRSESALAGAMIEVSRRESDLLAARVELWRQRQRAR